MDISPSTVHNIIKRFKESGGISVRKGKGRKPKLNNRDLRSLRRHCIKNPHSIYKRYHHMAQDYFGKPLSSTTIRSYIHKCQLKLYCPKGSPMLTVSRSAVDFSGLGGIWETITRGNVTVVRWISISGIFWEEWDAVCSGPKKKRIIQTCYQQQVQKPGSVMVWGCVSALGKGNLHFCDGTIMLKST